MFETLEAILIFRVGETKGLMEGQGSVSGGADRLVKYSV